MTYRCGIGKNAARVLGLEAGPPHLACDTCGRKVLARTKGGGPPMWLLNGTSPRGWRTERINDWTRIDTCLACRLAQAKAVGP